MRSRLGNGATWKETSDSQVQEAATEMKTLGEDVALFDKDLVVPGVEMTEARRTLKWNVDGLG
jgi:hypothetical protein